MNRRVFNLGLIALWQSGRQWLAGSRYTLTVSRLSVRLSVCASVCLSVTLSYSDHIGWKSSKIISRLVSMGCSSLQCRPEHHGSTPKATPKNFDPKWPTPVKLSVADIRWQIATERSEIAQWSQCRAYRKPPSLLPMVQSMTVSVLWVE